MSALTSRMFDALKLDDVDQEDDEGENTEGNGQRYTGILWHVHTFVSVDTCIGPHTSNTHVTDSRSNHDSYAAGSLHL